MNKVLLLSAQPEAAIKSPKVATSPIETSRRSDTLRIEDLSRWAERRGTSKVYRARQPGAKQTARSTRLVKCAPYHDTDTSSASRGQVRHVALHFGHFQRHQSDVPDASSQDELDLGTGALLIQADEIGRFSKRFATEIAG